MNTLLMTFYEFGDIVGYLTCFFFAAVMAWGLYFVMKNYLEG